MKLSCKVIEDLLPLYHDRVCSPESSLLVAEHLRQCKSCREVLGAMEADIPLPDQPRSERRVLERIREQWNKTRRKALLRGAAMMLAVIMLLGGMAGGFWYGTQAAPYQELAERMDTGAVFPHESGRDGTPQSWIFPREYSLFREGYHFWLRLPGFLDFSGGVVSVYPDAAHSHWSGSGLRPNISLGVKLSGGEQRYIVVIDDHGQYLASFCVDGALNYIPGSYDEEEKVHLALLEEYRPEITEIIQAAKEVWGLEQLP